MDHTKSILISIPISYSIPATSFIKRSRTGPVKGHMTLVLVPDVYHCIDFPGRGLTFVITHPLLPVILYSLEFFCHSLFTTVFFLIIFPLYPGISNSYDKCKPSFFSGFKFQLNM